MQIPNTKNRGKKYKGNNPDFNRMKKEQQKKKV